MDTGELINLDNARKKRLSHRVEAAIDTDALWRWVDWVGGAIEAAGAEVQMAGIGGEYGGRTVPSCLVFAIDGWDVRIEITEITPSMIEN
jgi:hypothetical protein